MKVKYLLFAGLVLPATPALAQNAQTSTSQPIVVTGRGLDQTPATPAYDVQEIGRDQIVSTTSPGSSNSAVRTAAPRTRRRKASPCARSAAMPPAARSCCSTACR